MGQVDLKKEREVEIEKICRVFEKVNTYHGDTLTDLKRNSTLERSVQFFEQWERLRREIDEEGWVDDWLKDWVESWIENWLEDWIEGWLENWLEDWVVERFAKKWEFDVMMGHTNSSDNEKAFLEKYRQ